MSWIGSRSSLDEVIAELGQGDAGADRQRQRPAGVEHEEVPDPLLLEHVDDQRADPDAARADRREHRTAQTAVPEHLALLRGERERQRVVDRRLDARLERAAGKRRQAGSRLRVAEQIGPIALRGLGYREAHAVGADARDIGPVHLEEERHAGYEPLQPGRTIIVKGSEIFDEVGHNCRIRRQLRGGLIGAVNPGSERTLSFPTVLTARSPSLSQTPHGRAPRPTKIRAPRSI